MNNTNTQKTKGVKSFFKKYGYSILMILGLAATIFLIAYFRNTAKKQEITDDNVLTVEQIQSETEASEEIIETAKTEQTSFALPVEGAVVVRDYSEEEFVNFVSLGYYAVHKAVDFTSVADSRVYSIAAGKVLSVETTSNAGTKVVIEHNDGFKSVYSSLDSNLNVQAGQTVKAGQQIGSMSNSMLDEAELGVHLHFELLKDNVLVDPNLFIAISNK